MKPLQLHAIKW